MNITKNKWVYLLVLIVVFVAAFAILDYLWDSSNFSFWWSASKGALTAIIYQFFIRPKFNKDENK